MEEVTLVTQGYANNTFANALKGSVSGEAVTMKDVSPVEHDMGVKVRGKNLIPYPFTYETFQHNGITFTDNKDGTITLNGQNNGSGISNYNLFQSANNLSFLKPNTDYYLSCNLDNIIKSLRTVKLDGTYKYYTYGEINFSSDETPDRLFIQIKTTDTTTYDNTIVKLQIELGDTATDYTPYIPDLTAVKVRKQGKNLIPYPYAETTKTLNGITFTDNGDGTITANGTATAQTDFLVSQKLTVPEGTYILSNYIDADKRVFLSVKSNDGSIKYFNRTAFSIKYGDVIQWVYIRIQSGTVCENIIFYPQLELGTTATEYEPGITPIEYTPNTDGTVEGVTSLYPTTTLTTDTAGAIIDCEYNRDMNKAYSDLLQRIAALETVAVNNV